MGKYTETKNWNKKSKKFQKSIDKYSKHGIIINVLGNAGVVQW